MIELVREANLFINRVVKEAGITDAATFLADSLRLLQIHAMRNSSIAG